MKYRIYKEGNYFIIEHKGEYFYGLAKEVFVDKSNKGGGHYRVFNVKNFPSSNSINISETFKKDGSTYTEQEFFEFYTVNTGNFNLGSVLDPQILDALNNSTSPRALNPFLTLEDENLISALNAKQNILVSDTNIKTLNNESLLGSGNIHIDEINGDNGLNGTATSGFNVGGNAPRIKMEGGDGGSAVTSSDNNIAGNGGAVDLIAGDGGIATGGSGLNLSGNGGNATLQGGETNGGVAGFATVKGGNNNASLGFGGDVYIVPGFGNVLDDTDESLYNGTIFLDVSPNMTSVRGNTVIGNLVDDRVNRLQVTGKIKTSSSIQIGDNTDVATVDNEGAIRYRIDSDKGYVETVIQTGISSYAWVRLAITTDIDKNYVNKIADYTLTDTDFCVDLTANSATFTLPTAVGRKDKQFIVKNSGSGTTLTLATTLSQTIDGTTTKIYNTQYSGTRVISDGANWKIIGNF